MTFCPFCGVRQDVNLRQIHFRDLGPEDSLPCPHCTTPLGVIEFDSDPKIHIERCTTCFGTFFNPGELETLLDAQTNPLVWLDPAQLERIAADYAGDEELVYRKCPQCSEWMSRLNFGGHSGVVIDSCGAHGVWLEGSELRRLTEWWRAGGKLIYQQNQADRAKRLYQRKNEWRETVPLVSIESKQPGFDGSPENIAGYVELTAEVIGGILSWIAD